MLFEVCLVLTTLFITPLQVDKEPQNFKTFLSIFDISIKYISEKATLTSLILNENQRAN